MGKSEKARRALARVEITHLLAEYQRMVAVECARGANGTGGVRDGVALTLDCIHWGEMTPASLRRVFATVIDEMNAADLDGFLEEVRSERETMRECGFTVDEPPPALDAGREVTA